MRPCRVGGGNEPQNSLCLGSRFVDIVCWLSCKTVGLLDDFVVDLSLPIIT